MEEKERYEVISPSLNGYAYIHDFKTDNVLNTYDSCDLLNQQDKEIKKLEEYNNKYPYHYSEEYMKNNRKLEAENQQLKQQLAEKEEELKYYETLLKRQCNECKDQDKISFCIEKLKKVKKLLEEKYSYDVEESDFAVIYEDDVDEIIDKQIASLKNGVE